jgi:hypothetical protein
MLERSYEVDLWAAPSPVWRTAFLRPPPTLTTASHTPDSGRVAHFRAASRERGDWHRQIDRWIAYANSVVDER